MSKQEQHINIKNRRATDDYEVLDKFVAGLQLKGSEIKSIRGGDADLADSFCTLVAGELFVHKLHISEYANAGFDGHEAKRDRKLLVSKQELKKIAKKVKDVGLTIIPLRLFINDRGWAKLEIAIAKGKKQFDKRESIKQKDIDRQLKRGEKDF